MGGSFNTSHEKVDNISIITAVKTRFGIIVAENDEFRIITVVPNSVNCACSNK